jgi:non-ribosomal peptide synthase protein (TIGR01720 family)
MNPKQIEDFFHLTAVQKYLLRQSEQAPAQAYVAQFSCQLEGSLDVPAFERAWQKTMDHQPSLRLTFVSGDLKEPVQVVNRNVRVEMEKQDWRNLAAEDQARRLAEIFQADRQPGFVLQTPPLWRMTLVRLREELYQFIWTYHELLFDERSLPLLFNEALSYYQALLHGKNLSLPLPVSLRKYLEWGKKAAAPARFWQTYLRGFSEPTPLTLTLPATTTQLAGEKAGTLRALAEQQYIAPEIMAYGAWALLLSRLSGQVDVVFGITVSGRPADLHGAERLIGHLRNTVPFRVRIQPDAMVVEWLTELQNQWAELLHYCHSSLAQIESWSEVVAPQPLFTSVVVFEAATAGTSLTREVAGLQIHSDSLVSPNHFPLAVMVQERGTWELTGDAHITQLRFLLEQFAIAPQRRLAEIVLPTESESRAVTATETAPTTSVSLSHFLTNEEEQKQEQDMFARMSPEMRLTVTPEEEEGWVDWLKGDPCVHELFEARVAETPEATAVQLQGQTLTYRELNARANQLAHYLRKLNVVPAIPVGLCFAPSVEGIVALLGVLKAGGAYLPLEATLGEDELQAIITESDTSVLLTQARLEPRFRTAPLHCIVLCLDSDWSLIAEEAADNLVRQVSNEHPACFLIAAEMPAVITHARLAQAVGSRREWFRFTPDDPWHLFGALPPEPAPTTEPTTEPTLEPTLPTLEDTTLNGSYRGMDWFDLQPEVALGTALAKEPLPLSEEANEEAEVAAAPTPDATPDTVSDTLPDTLSETKPDTTSEVPAVFALELDEAMETSVEAAAPEELELDVLLPPEPAPPVIDAADVASDVIDEVVLEPSSLAPIQQSFFARPHAAPQYWNVSRLVEIEEHLEPDTLQQALRLVMAQHEALRWRFVETQAGWQLQTAAEATMLPFEYVDFSTKWARSQRKAIEETAEKLQATLHLSDGPLWRAAYFDLGPGRPHRLLIIAHQLIADEPSLHLFLNDVLTTYGKLHRGEEAALPLPTASYQDWWQALVTAVQPEERQFWQRLQTQSWQALPVDHPDKDNTYGLVDRVFVSLNSSETERLLQQVPAAAEADISEVVLTALTLALANWAGDTGVWIELERDARILPSEDVSRTMGWFAMQFPIWLEADTAAAETAALQAVQAQLRAIPSSGFSYGMWRYNRATAASLSDVPQPQVSFKYLAFPPEETMWRVAPEAVGPEHDPHNTRPVLIAVTGAMNLNMLEFRWDYAKAQFEQKTIGILVNGFIGELRRLIRHYAP